MITAEGLFVTDERQRIVSWSASVERMLGFAPEEVVGQHCFMVVMGREPGGHPVCRRGCPVIANARHRRGTASYEVTARARDGSRKLMSNSVLVVDGPGKKFHVIHLLHEIHAATTVERRGHARLAEADGGGRPRIGPETLTRRELEVFRMFASGSTLDEIAAALSISTFTVRNHLASVQRKVGARNRLEAVLTGMRAGLV